MQLQVQVLLRPLQGLFGAEVDGDIMPRRHSPAGSKKSPRWLFLVVQGIFGAGAHSDWGCITLLLTDGTPGLQIYAAGSWQNVIPAASDAFIVNLGDMLER